MPNSDYRKAVKKAIADWNAPPTVFGVSFPTWRSKSAASTNAVAHMRAAMDKNGVYDDFLVKTVQWILRDTVVRQPFQQPAADSRLATVLGACLADDPAPRLLAKIERTNVVGPFRLTSYKGQTANGFIFSSHGLWDQKAIQKQGHDAFVKVQYTYNFYCDPGVPLTGEKYVQALGTLTSARRLTAAKDTMGPGSGLIHNLILLGMEDFMIEFTERQYKQQMLATGCTDLPLLTYSGTKEAMTLKLFDEQLLPTLKIPTNVPIFMVVCRARD